MRYLILDIEAVVDPSVWTPPEDAPDAFAPVFAWRPICVASVLLESDPGFGSLSVVRLGVLDDDDERTLLERFHASAAMKLAERPALVTWNGRRYDLPVLMLRSLRYGGRLPWYYAGRDTRYRYTEAGHCDLADAMSDYGACPPLGLDGMARLIGLPGKPKGADEVSGKNVAAAYAAGRMPEIAAYCLADAVQTAFLWLRWEVLKGEMSREVYRTSAERLLRACEADERLGGLVASVDRRVLLLEQGQEAAA